MDNLSLCIQYREIQYLKCFHFFLLFVSNYLLLLHHAQEVNNYSKQYMNKNDTQMFKNISQYRKNDLDI